MVKARDILFQVSKILSIVFAIIWGILAIVYIILGAIGIIGGIIGLAAGEDGGAATLVGGIGFLIGAIIFALIMVFAIINIKLSAKAPVVNEKNTYIAAIVFGVLSGTEVGIVGAIFGLILLNQQNNANNAQTVDAKPEEATTEAPAEETKADDKPADSTDAE